MSKRSAAEIESFVQQWVARHIPAVGAPNLAPEIDRLASHLTGDARAHGISGGEIHDVLGDIDDYLSEHCRRGAA
jgi:hypothetical protein